MIWHCIAKCLRKLTWCAAGVTFIFVVILLLMSFYIFSNMHTKHQAWYNLPSPCQVPKTTMFDMVQLAHKIDVVFREVGVSYVLCYGTLWGALRQGSILPWDNNIDVCALKSEFSKVPYSKVQEAMLQEGVTIESQLGGGECLLKFSNAVGMLHLWTVSSDGDFALPSGWLNLLVRLVGKPQPYVPVRLLESPLSSVPFHGKGMPVPHENIEMLKYLYPDDWWLEVRPPGCLS